MESLMLLSRSAFLLVLMAAMLAGCGGDESDDDGGTPVPPAVGEPTPPAEEANVPPAVEERTPVEIGEAGDTGAAVIESHELSPTYISVLVSEAPLADPLDLEVIARPFCEGRSACRVEIWFDRTFLALALPVQHQQTEAVAFAYGVNLAGRETTHWNCRLFPEIPSLGRRCLPTTE
jgi:hypothetical protein